MSAEYSESVVEDPVLASLEAFDCAVVHGRDIALGEPGAERTLTEAQ